jgi:hypothetical protein
MAEPRSARSFLNSGPVILKDVGAPAADIPPLQSGLIGDSCGQKMVIWGCHWVCVVVRIVRGLM